MAERIGVFTARNIEELAQRMTESMPLRQDAFYQPRIFFPSLQMQKWFTLWMAGHAGIALSARQEFIEHGLWKLLLEADAERTDAGAGSGLREGAVAIAPLQRETLAKMVLAVLRSARGVPQMRIFEEYLSKGPELARARREWQLSDRMARLFREYEHWQPELVSGWLGGGTSTDTGIAAAEGWIFTEIFKTGGLRDRVSRAGQAPHYLSLLQYAQIFDGDRPDAGTLGAAGPVFIFTFNEPSPGWKCVFKRLSQWFEFRIFDVAFALPKKNKSVVQEKWLDVQACKQRFFEELCPGSCSKTAPAAPQAGTLLGAVQAHLREGVRSPRAQDASLQLVACPSIRREVETVYNIIVHHIKNEHAQGGGLRLNEIGVLVPDLPAYKPVIESVFARDPGLLPRPLPYNLTDSSAMEDSAYAQAVLQLLALGEDGFNRREVFELLFNPCCMAGCRVDRGTVETWLSWAGKLNIFGNKAEGSSLPLEVYAWSHGLRRMRLGRIMDTSDGGRLLSCGGVKIPPFADMDSQSGEAVGRFCRVIETLRDFCEKLKTNRTLAEWPEFLCAKFDELLSVPPEREEESAVQAQLQRTLKALPADQAFFGSGALKLPFAMVRELIADSLAGIPARHGNYLLGGVTISALKPGRPVPFEIVCVLGLGEGQLAGSDLKSGLDVRGEKGLRQTQLARHALLEAILSARRQVYLSYVHKDLRKMQDFFPCCVVAELRNFIETEVLPPAPSSAGGVRVFEAVEIPLDGADPRRRLKRKDSDAPWTEAQLAAITDLPASGYWLQDRVRAAWKNRGGLPKQTREQLAQMERGVSERMKLRVWNGLPPPQQQTAAALPAQSAGERQAETVSIHELAKFLEDPVEALLARHLHVSFRETEDAGVAECEPLVSAFAASARLRTEPVEFVLRNKDIPFEAMSAEAEKRLAELHDDAFWSGAAPSGAFGEFEKIRLSRELRDVLDSGSKSGCAALIRQLGNVQSVVLGRTGRRLKKAERFAPLELVWDAASNRICALTGECEHAGSMNGQPGRDLLVLARAKPGPSEKCPAKHVLAPLVFALAARSSQVAGEQDNRSLASWWGGDSICRIHVLYQDTLLSWQYELPEPSAARERLAGLLRLLLKPDWTRLAWLPYEPCAELLAKNKNDPDFAGELRQRMEPSGHNSLWKDYLRLLPPMVPEDAQSLARERFGWIMAALRIGGKKRTESAPEAAPAPSQGKKARGGAA